MPRLTLANKNRQFADNKTEIVISMHYNLRLPKNNRRLYGTPLYGTWYTHTK